MGEWPNCLQNLPELLQVQAGRRWGDRHVASPLSWTQPHPASGEAKEVARNSHLNGNFSPKLEIAHLSCHATVEGLQAEPLTRPRLLRGPRCAGPSGAAGAAVC